MHVPHTFHSQRINSINLPGVYFVPSTLQPGNKKDVKKDVKKYMIIKIYKLLNHKCQLLVDKYQAVLICTEDHSNRKI